MRVVVTQRDGNAWTQEVLDVKRHGNALLFSSVKIRTGDVAGVDLRKVKRVDVGNVTHIYFGDERGQKQ